MPRMPHRTAGSCTLSAAIRAASGRDLAPPLGPLGIATSSRHRRWPRMEAGREHAATAAPTGGDHVRSEELARLEAVLFMAREPLTTRRLARLARLTDGTRARSLIAELRRLQEASGAAFRVEAIAGGYQLLTRVPFGPWVRRLHDRPAQGRLSAAALETLAIVTYRQPVTRAEIEAIRGVGSEEMLRQLLERDLVAVGGRAEELGRPNVYLTTRRFLAAFGLARIEDLPVMEVGESGASEAGNSQAGATADNSG
jgi:segregation and condensation protein B